MLIGYATGDNWLLGIATDKTDQHFHADSRNHHMAKTFTSPTGGQAYPATGELVALAFSVPVELNFYARVFVTPYFFTRRACYQCGLAAQSGLWCGLLGAKECFSGDGAESVAVTLRETAIGAAVNGG